MAKKPGLISGVVYDARERPVAQARVYFTDGPVPMPEIAMLTGEDGSFTLSVPVSGTYQIGFAKDEFAPTKVKVAVESGKQAHVKVKLKG
jgi:hypothetical protein